MNVHDESYTPFFDYNMQRLQQYLSSKFYFNNERPAKKKKNAQVLKI